MAACSALAACTSNSISDPSPPFHFDVFDAYARFFSERVVKTTLFARRAERRVIALVRCPGILDSIHRASVDDVMSCRLRAHLSFFLRGKTNVLRSGTAYDVQYAARLTAYSVPLMSHATALYEVASLMTHLCCQANRYASTYSIYLMMFDAACFTKNASLVMWLFRTLVAHTPPRSPRILKALRKRWSRWLDMYAATQNGAVPELLSTWWWHPRDVRLRTLFATSREDVDDLGGVEGRSRGDVFSGQRNFITPWRLRVGYEDISTTRGATCRECTVCYRPQLPLFKCTMCCCCMCRGCMSAWLKRNPSCPMCRLGVDVDHLVDM